MESEHEIALTALPEAVRTYCATHYAGYTLNEVSLITDASGKVRYEVELKKGKEIVDLIFDAQGNFSQREPSEMDKED